MSGSPPATSTTIGGLSNGTAYTFTVAATNAVGAGPASAPSNSVTPAAPSPPGAPTSVTATGGNASASANMSWAAPSSNGGSAITGYTVTPYVGSLAQAPTLVSGSPMPTSAKVSRLTNGTTYTFTVSATNAVGTGPASAASNPVTPLASAAPAFVQALSKHSSSVTSVAVAPSANVTVGDRLIVQVGVWSGAAATAKSVTDSAGNMYTELLHFKASENTELSVWSAPINAGAGTRPTITVTPTGQADVGVGVLEYSGLSSVSDASVVDQVAKASGTTGSSNASVASGPTPPTTAANELALGFYADSGFGDSLSAAAGFTPRVNISNTGDMEMLAEDGLVGSGATPNATVGTGPATVWLMATLVLKGGP